MFKIFILIILTLNLSSSFAALDDVSKLVKISENEWSAVCSDGAGEYYTKSVTTNDILSDTVCSPSNGGPQNACVEFTKSNLHYTKYDSLEEITQIINSCSRAKSSTLGCLKSTTSSLHYTKYDSLEEISELIKVCQ